MPNENYPLALPEGTVLAGQFVIDEVLGQGGFGITYKATDHNTGEKVAIKEYYPDTMVSRTGTTVIPYTGERQENFKYGLDCFLREAETLAKYVDTDGIVSIKSYFEENGTAYFVMEYVEGESFEDYIKEKGGKISYEEAKNVLLPVIDALSCVHKDGIVHRDVTPDNIFITKDGQVRLLDFGAARYSIGDKSRSLDVVLKHGYAPKEQYTRHGKQGPFTAIYTVGVCFYFAITGRLPVDSIDRLEEDDVVPPSTLGVDIKPEVEEAILKAMAVQPADRFKSMDDFKAALLEDATPVNNDAIDKLVYCPSCGAANKAESKFCKSCGGDMNAPAAVVEEPAATQKTVAVPEPVPAPKKKKNIGLIAAIIVICLAVIGGAGGFAYYKMKIEPEKLAEEQAKEDKKAIKDDESLADSVKTAVLTSIMDPVIVTDSDYSFSLVNDGKRCEIEKWGSNIVTDNILELLGCKSFEELKEEISYRNATGKIYVSIGSDFGVYVEIECSDDVEITAGTEPSTSLADLQSTTETTTASTTDPEPEPEPSTDPSTTTTTTSGSYCSLAGLTETYVNNAAEGGNFNEYSNGTFFGLYFPDELYGSTSTGQTYSYNFSDDVCNINIISDYVIFLHEQTAYYYQLSTGTASVMSTLSDYYPMRRIIASDNGMVFIYGDSGDYKVSLLNTDGTVSHYYYSVYSPSAVTVVDDSLYWVSTDGTKICAVSISSFDNDEDQSYYLYEGDMKYINYLTAGDDYDVYFNGTNSSGDPVVGRVSTLTMYDTATSLTLPDGYTLSGMNFYDNKLYMLLNDWTNYGCQLYSVDVSESTWADDFNCECIIDTNEGCFWSVGIQTAGVGTMMLAGCNGSGLVEGIGYLDGSGMNYYYSEW